MRIVRTIRIPRWWLAAYASDIPRVYEVFQDLLGGLSLSLSDLAKDIGVDQSTVSRWALGRTQPTPAQMKKLLAAVRLRITAIGAAAEGVSRAVEAFEGVGHAFESKGGGHARRIRRAAQGLQKVLKELEAGWPKRQLVRRSKRGRASKVGGP